MGNIVEDEKITHDLFVKRLAFQMATIKEIEYVDENGAEQILKRPAKVTMTVSMASPAAGTTGINFDRPVSPELWGKEEGPYARLRAIGAGEGDSRFGAAIRESSRGSEKKVDSRGSGALHRGHK